MLQRFGYVRSKSLDEAIDHLGTEGARVHAGGTDLLGCLREHIFDVEKVVSISGIKGLRSIEKTTNGGLRIGALSTITEVAEHPLIRERYPGLSQADPGLA